MDTEFRLIHLSDLHFSGVRDQSDPRQVHSIDMCNHISEKVKFQDFDRVLISGDVSNCGDKDSFFNVSEWLFDGLRVGNNQKICLNLQPEQVIIVPGNHDAFNRGYGKFEVWRQKSIENFNNAFPNHALDENDCCGYDWIEKNGVGLFIIYTDSCYMGDDFITEKVAKGNITEWQSTVILKYFDMGQGGQLIDKNTQLPISPNKFINSLKILVMHHYIFEPPGLDDDYWLKLKHKEVVLRNLAMADFDILLCGHKHIPSFKDYKYGDYFDARGKKRYLLNCFRRMIGINSLPIQFKTESGKQFPKMVTGLVSVLGLKMKRENNKDYIEKLIEILLHAIDKPKELEREIRAYFKQYDFKPEDVLTRNEVKELVFRLNHQFTSEQKKELRKTSRLLMNFMQSLDSRPFLQIACASSTKKITNFNHKEKERSYNEYLIKLVNNDFIIESKRYAWVNDQFEMVENNEFTFHAKRKLTFKNELTINESEDSRAQKIIERYTDKDEPKIS